MKRLSGGRALISEGEERGVLAAKSAGAGAGGASVLELRVNGCLGAP